jgi:hypothetical protein
VNINVVAVIQVVNAYHVQTQKEILAKIVIVQMDIMIMVNHYAWLAIQAVRLVILLMFVLHVI